MQVVNGTISEDGDTFLYGGKTLYKNLSTNEKAGYLVSMHVCICMPVNSYHNYRFYHSPKNVAHIVMYTESSHKLLWNGRYPRKIRYIKVNHLIISAMQLLQLVMILWIWIQYAQIPPYWLLSHLQDSLVMTLWLLPSYLAVTTVPGVSLEWVRR